jgi:hypothetical protein
MQQLCSFAALIAMPILKPEEAKSRAQSAQLAA